MEPTADQLTSLRLAVMRLARRLRQEHSGGLTPSQASALACVERLGPLSLRDLAEAEGVQPPSMSRIVGSLEGEGWVDRVADPADRRVVLVQATARAHRELGRLRAERNEWLAERIATLSDADAALLLAAAPLIERLLGEESVDAPGEGHA